MIDTFIVLWGPAVTITPVIAVLCARALVKIFQASSSKQEIPKAHRYILMASLIIFFGFLYIFRSFFLVLEFVAVAGIYFLISFFLAEVKKKEPKPLFDARLFILLVALLFVWGVGSFIYAMLSALLHGAGKELLPLKTLLAFFVIVVFPMGVVIFLRARRSPALNKKKPVKVAAVLFPLIMLLIIGGLLVEIYGPPVVFAVKMDNIPLTEFLLDIGMDVNAKNKYRHHSFPLMYAAAEREPQTEMVELLVKRGADVNAIDKYGWTALMRASLRGHYGIVRFLLDNGADPNIENKRSAFPCALLVAVFHRRVKVVALLLDRGANIYCRDYHKRTALDLAYEGKYTELIRLLENRGVPCKKKWRNKSLSQPAE